MRKVVESTSHSEMPSTPSLKWMPKAATHSLSTTWFHCAGSKSPSMNSDTPKVASATAKAKPRSRPSSSRGTRRHKSAPNSGRKVIERSASLLHLHRARLRDMVPQRGSIASTDDLVRAGRIVGVLERRLSSAWRRTCRCRPSRRGTAADGRVGAGAVRVRPHLASFDAWRRTWRRSRRPSGCRSRSCRAADDDGDDVALQVTVLQVLRQLAEARRRRSRRR